MQPHRVRLQGPSSIAYARLCSLNSALLLEAIRANILQLVEKEKIGESIPVST